MVRYCAFAELIGTPGGPAATSAAAAATPSAWWIAAWRRERQACQAEAPPDPVHTGATAGTGALLLQDALPGHIHARGTRHEDRTDRVARSGEPAVLSKVGRERGTEPVRPRIWVSSSREQSTRGA